MDTVEILKAARELISDPKRWTQRKAARDAGGNEVAARSSKAVCWCSLGVIAKVGGVGVGTCDAIDLLRSNVEDGFLVDFNDSHTHAEVLELFDRAIASATPGHEDHGTRGM